MSDMDTTDSNQPLREGNLQAQPRVVIVGVGFGGLEAAKALRHVPVQVTVIDHWNHHLFQPMLSVRTCQCCADLYRAWAGTPEQGRE